MVAESIKKKQISKPVRHKKNHKIVPTKSKAIIAMKQLGMSNCSIAKELNLTPSGVWRHLKRVYPQHQEFSELKTDLANQYVKATLDNLNLSAKITEHLVNIPQEELEKINPVNLAAIKRTADVGAGIAHEHYRLEANLTTQNIGALIGVIHEMQSRDED